MASNFPTSLPGLTTDYEDDVDSIMAANQNQPNLEINALADKVGITSSAVTSSHDYKLSGVTSTAKALSDAALDTDGTLSNNSDTRIATQKATKTYADTKTTLVAVLAVMYPVGSIYINAGVSTNPATLFGFGTWEAYGAGKMIIGLDSGDTDFDSLTDTGGAKTKTIAQANLPNISTGAGTAHAHAVYDPGHAHTTGLSTTGDQDGSGSNGATYGTGLNTGASATGIALYNESAHTHSLGGSGTALNIMNPYVVAYMWKRIQDPQ